MKNHGIVAAIAATLPICAIAQSNVTLYGIADAGVGYADTGQAGSSGTMVVESGYQSTSRFGIRGQEDLGNGLKVTFNLEAGVALDMGSTDAAGFFQRRSVVGLAGSFGEVRLGRDYTPAFLSGAATDVMALGLYGNWANFTAPSGLQTRGSNGIHYTGTFNGVTLRAMYSEGETNDVACPAAPAAQPPMCGPKSARDMWGLAAIYGGGPLTLQGHVQNVNNNAGDGTRHMGVGAGYRFGTVRVTGNYSLSDADSATTVQGGEQFQGLSLGVGVKIAGGELLAQAIRLRVKDHATLATDPRALLFGMAYTYPLSKRTNLYATYGQTRNSDGARFNLMASGNLVSPVNANDDPKGFAVGVRHLF